MSLADKLTSLADIVRLKYLIANKLSLSDMAGILSDHNKLDIVSTDKLYKENVKVSEEQNGWLITNDSSFDGRIAINFKNGRPLNKMVGIYFQASTNMADKQVIKVGPIGGNMATFEISGSKAKGYFATIQYNFDSSLSVSLPKGISITISNIRAWTIN